MFVFKAGVVGAGTMGGEIAQTIAAAGIPVVLSDIDAGAIDRGLARARSVWQAQVDAGKLDADAFERQYALIEPVTGYDAFGDVDFVVEAVPEVIELKREVFAELDACTPGRAILASNTSALSITEIADATVRPEQVVGFHYFYPASRARLVEVVEGEFTAPETVQAAVGFAQAIRKTPVRCADAPGFVVNRILGARLSEAWRTQVESGAEPAEIDAALTESGAAPIGPFALADRLGLDTVLHVSGYLEESLGESFFVHPQLRELVRAGKLGRKAGEGFYRYG